MQFLVLSLVLFLTACGSSVAGFDIRPRPNYLQDVPKDAPPNYKQGWKDGCESGLSAFGNTFYKSVYNLKKDKSLINDRLYLRAWTDAFDYCRSKVNRDLLEGLWWGPGFGGGGEGVFPTLGGDRAPEEPTNFFDQVLSLNASGGVLGTGDLRDTAAIKKQGFNLPMMGQRLKFPGER